MIYLVYSEYRENIIEVVDAPSDESVREAVRAYECAIHDWHQGCLDWWGLCTQHPNCVDCPDNVPQPNLKDYLKSAGLTPIGYKAIIAQT